MLEEHGMFGHLRSQDLLNSVIEGGHSMPKTLDSIYCAYLSVSDLLEKWHDNCIQRGLAILHLLHRQPCSSRRKEVFPCVYISVQLVEEGMANSLSQGPVMVKSKTRPTHFR